MKLAIFEPRADGHHMILHVRYIVKQALERDWTVTLVTTNESMLHPAYQAIKKLYGKNLETYLMPNVVYPKSKATPLNLLRYQFDQYFAFKFAYSALCKVAVPDVIYLCNLDYFDKVLPFLGSPFGSTKFMGLLMSVSVHHEMISTDMANHQRSIIYSWLFQRLLHISPLHKVLTIDEILTEYLNKEQWKNCHKVVYVPDIASTSVFDISRKEAREELGIKDNQFTVLIYGAITFRKGVRELVQSLFQKYAPQNVLILLAGEQDESIRGYLSSPKVRGMIDEERILQIDHFLDDREEFLVFQASDVGWLGYKGFKGMSGVLVKSAMFGMPVISCNKGLLGWMTQKYQLGEIVDIENVENVISAIIRMITNEESYIKYSKNGRSIASRHKGDKFGETICNLLEDALQ